MMGEVLLAYIDEMNTTIELAEVLQFLMRDSELSETKFNKKHRATGEELGHFTHTNSCPPKLTA